nr:HipA domain-containing protein [Pseudopedobacter sp.]
MSKAKLITYKIENRNGFSPSVKCFDLAKSHQVIALNETVGGDAPKDLIRLYTYGEGKKDKPKSWKKYIAKIGHKWYPNESITEHLLTVVGQCFGLSIANSRLIYAENYVRYLSEHFHSEEQILSHGANILTSYLNEDSTAWIDDLDRTNKLKGEIHIDDVIFALNKVFPQESKNIINGFLHMILFDALTGNNDRHYYNWGVISHIKNLHPPYFSPVYDTARGLYWNNSDKDLLSLHKELTTKDKIRLTKYVLNSVPKISVPNNPKCNHFDLISHLHSNGCFNEEHILTWTNETNIKKVLYKLQESFSHLFTKERKEVIAYILSVRFQKICSVLLKD